MEASLSDRIRGYLGEARLAQVEERLVETGRTLEVALGDVVTAVEKRDFAPENQVWMGAMTLRRMVGIRPSMEDVAAFEAMNRVGADPAETIIQSKLTKPRKPAR